MNKNEYDNKSHEITTDISFLKTNINLQIFKE